MTFGASACITQGYFGHYSAAPLSQGATVAVRSAVAASAAHVPHGNVLLMKCETSWLPRRVPKGQRMTGALACVISGNSSPQQTTKDRYAAVTAFFSLLQLPEASSSPSRRSGSGAAASGVARRPFFPPGSRRSPRACGLLAPSPRLWLSLARWSAPQTSHKTLYCPDAALQPPEMGRSADDHIFKCVVDLAEKS